MKWLIPILLALPFLGLFAWITFRNAPPELPKSNSSRPKERAPDVRQPLPSLPDDRRRPKVAKQEPRPEVVPEAEVAVLLGAVLLPDGEAAGGVLVYLTVPGAVVHVDGPKTVTDQAGRFLLPAPPGDCDIIAWQAGLVPAVAADVRVAAGDRKDLGILKLTSGLAIEGRVVDTEGRAIPDAAVGARSPDLHLPEGGLPGRTAIGRFTAAAAGPDGTFRLTGLLPGALLIFGDALGYKMAAEPQEVPAGETGVVITLQRLLLLTGRILRDVDGRPIPDATVKLEIRTERFTGAQFFKTASDGRFSFDLTNENLDGEEVELALLVSGSGYVEQTASALSLDDLSPEKKFVLRLIEAVVEEPGTLLGRVLYDTGAPFIGSITLSFSREGSAGDIFRVRTDEEGRFKLTGIPPGEYKLHSAPHSSEILLATGKVLLITAGGEEMTEFTVPRGGDVKITVTDARGEAVAGAEAALLDAAGATVRVNPAGEDGIVFHDLSPGEVHFRVTAPGHKPVTLTTTIEKDRAVGLTARLSEVRWRILLLIGVLIAAGAVVTAFVLLLDDPEPFAPQAPSRETDPEDPLPDIPVADPMSVTGRVVDPAGAPLASVDVYLLSPENPLVPTDEPLRVRTGEDGTFILRGMKGERVDIVAFRAGFRPGVVTDVSPGTTHRLTLEEGLVVAGTVTDDAGRPLSGVRVTARTSGTNFVPSRGLFLPNHEALPLTWVRTLSGADGAFKLRGVGEGLLDITGKKRGYPGMENPLSGFDPLNGFDQTGGPARIVMLRPFIASITVRDAESSDPLPRVAVTVSRVDAEKEQASGRTNHRGLFTGKMPWPAAQAPDCRVSIVAWDRRYGEIRADGIALEKVEEGKGFTLHAIRREPGVVRLQVVYDTGEPYAQWIGFRFEVTSQVNQFRGGRPDEDGFVTMSVPAGTYPVVRAAAAGTVGQAEIAGLQVLSGVTVTESLVVERGGDVQFHFEGGKSGDRVSGRMRLVSGDFNMARGVWGRDIRIRDLPPGDFEVTLGLRDYEPVTLPVKVVKGKVIEVPVTLRRQ